LVTFVPKQHAMNTNDLLAIERTKLANERTFLAYFRTFIVFLSSGFAIIKLDLLKDISLVGYALIILAPILLFMGIFRYFRTRKRLKKYYS
jgi:putative membrane protein